MAYYKEPLILPRPSNSAPPFLSNNTSIGSSSSPMIGKSAALKIHSQAEKRRRERINSHLSTLRRMVPDSAKMDKASLLGSVIDQVKDLKRKATDIGRNTSIPKEANEVKVESRITDESNSDNKSFYIKASVCCEDHPDLFVTLMRTFHGLRLRAIKADITSLGGRVQTVFILCEKDVGKVGCGSSSSVSIGSLKESVKIELARVANSFDVVAVDASPSKRQRLLHSYYSAAGTI